MPLPTNDNDTERLRARLALSSEREIADWQKKEEYLERRKKEAAQILSSDEQKKKQAEEEQEKINRLNAQKKLAELEAKRRLEEKTKRKDIATVQKEQDEAAEKLRQEKIKEILESKKTIQTIRGKEAAGLSPIQTLTRDVGQAIEGGRLTAAKIASINREKQPAKVKEPLNVRKAIILVLGLLLILSSSAFLVYALWQKAKENYVPIPETHNSIIFADEHIKIDLSDQTAGEVINKLKSELATPSNREKIKDLYFIYTSKRQTEEGLLIEKKLADFSVLASSTNLNINRDFARFLDPDFMLGFYSNTQSAPFFIFKTENFGNVAEILIHNEGEIISNLLSFFNDNPLTEQIKNTPFVDKMVRNYNLRLAIDNNNQTLALYAWLDKKILLIAPNELIFEKVLNSYLTSKPTIK